MTGARLYLTRANGGELLLAGDYPLGAATVILPTLPDWADRRSFATCRPCRPASTWPTGAGVC
ncbi:hypothetical protein MNU23_31065 [Pseudomonas aeruginosa]|uniref:hypothetical protein n=1 Tax=Pseudomonas aeruginosa TaxID=287 RepID=UPI0021A52EFE|nr:hypothetical protein [Pseudomonas aeruginosa]MCT2416121.1 hypothetical protein [Pseudomonas aeruginosa]